MTTGSRFSGRVAIITGAGGDIGAEAAIAFAQGGARIAIFDRKAELLDDTAERCSKEGAEVLALGMDQMDRDAVEVGIAAVVAQYGRVDALFANAGYGKFSSFLEQPVKEWERHVGVNLTGTFHVCQVVAQRMVDQAHGGAIVINASSGATQHADLLSAYCATKAALRMLTTSMASELGVHRIRVNAVQPGVVETGMTAPMLNGPDGDRHRELITANTPVGRLGVPVDVANLVTFLASDEAAYINGQSIMIDGGQTINGHPRWFQSDYRRAHEENWGVGL
jgi:NAD(P)-dependent dehydrogenase (short-subunit alcohol dehydrogenase family)